MFFCLWKEDKWISKGEYPREDLEKRKAHLLHPGTKKSWTLSEELRFHANMLGVASVPPSQSIVKPRSCCLSTPGWISLVYLNSALVPAVFSVLQLHIIQFGRPCRLTTSLQSSWGSSDQRCLPDIYCKGNSFHWISSKVQIPGYKAVWR